MKFSRPRSVPAASIEISQGTAIGARLNTASPQNRAKADATSSLWPAHSHELLKTVMQWWFGS